MYGRESQYSTLIEHILEEQAVTTDDSANFGFTRGTDYYVRNL
ncbi:hypothetical protein [Alkaliphilus metalliredigens]|nr:hypothetical protein [Alkaliphilus metalliredigens]